MKYFTTQFATVVGILLLATFAYGQQIKIADIVLETSTELASLPTSVPSTMIARTCSQCEAQILNVTDSTQFFISGNRAVSLEKLRQSCGSRAQGIGIALDPKTKNVLRIVTGCSA